MKKYYFIFAAAMAFLAACNNEDNVVSNDPTPSESQNITYIRAEADEGATTRGSVDDEAIFTWNEGDKIAVYADGYKISNALGSDDDGKSSVDFAFSGDNVVTESDRANYAIYPASLVWNGSAIRKNSALNHDKSNLTLTLPASYTLTDVQNDVSPTPMIATNAPSGSLSFKALCPLLRVTVNNIPKQTKRLEFDFNGKKVQGEFMLTSVDAGTTAIATSATDDTDDIITVTMEDNTTWHDNLVVNLPVPRGSYDKIIITAYNATSGGQKVLSIKTPIKSATAAWEPTRKASRKMSATLPVFTINSTGTKVAIAPGNLQATTSDNGVTWTWAFAAHQYDRLGNTTANTNNGVNGYLNINGTVDYFAWSIDNKYGLIRPSESISYGSSVTILKDWGENIISGYPANTWRTPTGGGSQEWHYIFSLREGTTLPGYSSKCTYARATVNDVNGYILFPDVYTYPINKYPVEFNNSYPSEVSWEMTNASNKKFSVAEWEELEAAGAVFLPAAGYVSGSTFYDYNDKIYYWSSTHYSSTSTWAYAVKQEGYLNHYNGINKRCGLPVRLICVLN